jgi:hypothetical protein
MPTPLAGPPIIERRRAPRTRCLREGRCIFNKGCSDLTVMVRNLSATGAKLTGDELHFLPDEFELQMSDGVGGVVSRRAKRVWSKPDSMGVVFVDAASNP